MIVYVAGPMTGIEGFNYPAFESAGSELRVRGMTVLNPIDSELENETGKPESWDWYMRRALRMVTEAEGMCLLPGWQQSNGAQLEVNVGEALKLDIRPLDEWLKVKVLPYVVCDALLDPEWNTHCEFDGYRPVDAKGFWLCPGCGRRRYEPVSAA